MKIYSYVKIDIETGEVLEEESHEYDGPIAECGKGGAEVEYMQSPEAREMLNSIQPLLQGLAGYGAQNMYAPGGAPWQQPVPSQQGGGQWTTNTIPLGGMSRAEGTPLTRDVRQWVPGGGGGPMGGFELHGQGYPGAGVEYAPNMGAPSAPQLPSMEGVLSGVPMYDVPGYNIPSAQSMMPGENWWADLDPSIKAGIQAPYNDMSNQLTETLGAKGMTGSASSPHSGTSQAGLGQFWADATPQIAQQGWGMVAPALQAEWGAQLGQNQQMWGEQLGQNKLGYQQNIQEAMGGYQNQVAQMQSDYGTSMQAWQMPFNLLGMAPGLTPTGVLSPGGPSPFETMSGGLTGGLGGYAVGGPVGAGIGGLAGLLGGK